MIGLPIYIFPQNAHLDSYKNHVSAWVNGSIDTEGLKARLEESYGSFVTFSIENDHQKLMGEWGYKELPSVLIGDQEI